MWKAAKLGALTTLLLLSLCTAFAYAEAQVGIKAGDWIKYDATTSGADLPSNMPQWVKIEFISVTETAVTFREIHHMSSGEEQSEIRVVDAASGEGNATFQMLIPANSKVGDTIQIVQDEGEYGNITISSEKTENYAGASRTALCTSLSQEDTQLNYCWDKQTGVLLEIKWSQGSAFIVYRATSTNIWHTSSSSPLTLPSLPVETLSITISAALAIAIITAALVYTKHKEAKLNVK
jgi:hypothetical protein